MYLLRLYQPLIDKIRAYRKFNRAFVLAGRTQDAHIIYEAWVELFVDRLNMPQREKDLGSVVAPYLDKDQCALWENYTRLLERMAFEKTGQEFDTLREETRNWVSKMKGRL